MVQSRLTTRGEAFGWRCIIIEYLYTNYTWNLYNRVTRPIFKCDTIATIRDFVVTHLKTYSFQKLILWGFLIPIFVRLYIDIQWRVQSAIVIHIDTVFETNTWIHSYGNQTPGLYIIAWFWLIKILNGCLQCLISYSVMSF